MDYRWLCRAIFQAAKRIEKCRGAYVPKISLKLPTRKIH